MNQGKVAIVSGAGGGIGREIALALARTGAAVVVNDIGVSVTGEGGSATPAEETKRLIEDAGGTAAVDTHSVDGWESARAIVATALDAFGRIDIVVNNAGILRDTIFHKMTAEQWLSVVGVHLNGSFFLSRAAAEHFRRQESGAFVHMTSTSGLIGNFGQANYAAAKLGICALSKSIALDMRRFNVRSNCIAPFAWSRMTSEIPADTDEQRERIARLKRMTAREERPARRVSRVGCGARHLGPGLRRAPQRDLPLRSLPARPQRPPQRGLGRAGDRRPCPAGAAGALRRARPLRRRVQLGSALTRISHQSHGLRGALRSTEQESREARCGDIGRVA